MIPQSTIDELVDLRSMAKLASEAFSDAVAAQAEKHQVNKAALRKYVSALEAATLGKLDEEMNGVLELIEKSEKPV